MYIYTYLCILAFFIDVISKTTEIRPSFDIHIHIHFLSLSLTSSIQSDWRNYPSRSHPPTHAFLLDDSCYYYWWWDVFANRQVLDRIDKDYKSTLTRSIIIYNSIRQLVCSKSIVYISLSKLPSVECSWSIGGHRITKQWYQIQEWSIHIYL